MSHKNMLSIGEMSKLTGAGKKALRYYERIKILPPAYIEPDSGYRYYSLDQIYLVDIIMFCVELDIPLKELTNLADENDSVDFGDFLVQGKQIAERKMKTLQKGLRLISEIERKKQMIEMCPTGQIYSREIPEKIFYVKPCGQSLEGIDQLEIVRAFLDIQYADENFVELPEYGFMCEHSPAGASYFAFVEVPPQTKSKNIMRVPGGTYFCRQDANSNIEQAPEIFKEQLAGKDSFLVIEIEEIFIGKHKKSKPISELRVIAL